MRYRSGIMPYMGDKGRSEVIRFWLTLDAAPTGTPTITITRGQGTALDTPITTQNMTQGASTLEWYYDYTTEAAAQVGLYTAKFIAVVDSVTRYAYDQYDVTINDADDIITDTTSIESKIDTIDANVDTIKDTDLPAVKTDTAAILVDTGTTLPATLTTIEGKIDTTDSNLDSLIQDTGMDGTTDQVY
jgi:hypothetical protein